MPKAHLTTSGEPDTAELVRSLRDEWLGRPQHDGPVIIEDPGAQGHRRLLVVWDRWQALPIETRSAVIMDAYREVAPVKDVLRVTIAWGMTAAEAAQLGIQYTIDQ